MKIARKGWLLIFLGILGIAAAALLGFACWVVIELGVENVPADVARPTEAGVVEARRKLAILEQPAQPQGYVDFTEGELNSLVHDLFFAKKTADDRKTPSLPASSTTTSAWRLKRIRFKLNETSIDCYAWVSRTLIGKEWNICWTRSVTLNASANQWMIGLQSVRVGGREIPFRYWPATLSSLGKADEPAVERFQWLRRLPWMELHVDKDKPIPQVRIYNYVPETPAKP
jgi:hypothetical protein